MNDESRPRPPSAVPKPAAGERSFLHRVALVNVMVIAFFLGLAAIWFAADALLLIFACILFAVLLYDVSRKVCARGCRFRAAWRSAWWWSCCLQ
jgi:hypothetical protein